jgi:hypothetical protein
VKWLADENFDNDIVRGVLRRSPELDMVRAQDLPQVAGEDDVALLAWATQDGRIVLTHDLSTMIPAMHEQLRRASVCAPMVLDRTPFRPARWLSKFFYSTSAPSRLTGLRVLFTCH